MGEAERKHEWKKEWDEKVDKEELKAVVKSGVVSNLLRKFLLYAMCVDRKSCVTRHMSRQTTSHYWPLTITPNELKLFLDSGFPQVKKAHSHLSAISQSDTRPFILYDVVLFWPSAQLKCSTTLSYHAWPYKMRWLSCVSFFFCFLTKLFMMKTENCFPVLILWWMLLCFCQISVKIWSVPK